MRKKFNIIDKKPPLPIVNTIFDESEYLDNAARWLAKKIKLAQAGTHNLVLFGDFDVDGTTSTVIMQLFNKCAKIDSASTPFISKRSDGYGLTRGAMDRMYAENTNPKNTTIVLMDLGISTTKETEEMLARGYSVMVIDHHVPAPEAPAEWTRLRETYGDDKVLAYDPLLHLNEPDCYKSLSAAGLVYKICFRILELDLEELSQGIFENERIKLQHGAPPQSLDTILNSMAKLSAIAQASDCMPFVKNGETTLAWSMAKEFESKAKLLAGINVLYSKTNTASRIGWVIGPIINALGRIEDAYAAYELMIESIPEEAAKKLASAEEVRKKVRAQTQKAHDNISNDLCTSKGVAVLIAEKNTISSGIVGIGAGRASELLRAPALYLTEVPSKEYGSILKGSMRRGETSFSCEKWILELKQQGIILGGGGHPAAAGLSLLPSNRAALITSAESQQFETLEQNVYKCTVTEAQEYINDVEKTLPFGNSHESNKIKIIGNLTNVKPLMTSRSGTPECWAYDLLITDSTTRLSLKAKIMRSDLSDEMLYQLDKISSKNINIPFACIAVVHDNYKIDSRFPRCEYRVLADFPDNALEQGTEENNSLTKDALIKFSSIEASETISDMALDTVDNRIKVVIDHNLKLKPNVFLLKKPSRDEITQSIGPAKAEELSDLHGGKWDREHRGYLITSGVIKDLMLFGSDDWYFEFTERAEQQWSNVKASMTSTMLAKEKTDPFHIPMIQDRDKWVPFGFQYADVRLYMDNDVSLCHNDMGTGKTFEASIWGVLKYHDAYLDKDRSPICSANPQRRPVLVLTMNSIVSQYKKELNNIYGTAKAQSYGTKEVRSFLINEKDISALTDKGNKLNPTRKIKQDSIEKFKTNFIGDSIFLILSYDTIARHPWIVSSIDWAGIILDEAHELKSPSAYKTIAVLGPEIDGAPLIRSEYKIPILALSGTFSKNRPSDWFPWVRLLKADGGVYTAGSCKNAKNRFDMRFDGLRYVERKVRGGQVRIITERGIPKNGTELKRMLEPYIVRRMKTELTDLPELTVHEEFVASTGLYLDVIAMLKGQEEISEESLDILDRYGLIDDRGEIRADIRSRRSKTPNADLYEQELKAVDPGSLMGRLAMISSLDKASGIMNFISEKGWDKPDKDGQIEPFVIMAFHQSAAKEIARRLDAAGIENFLMMQQDSTEAREAKKEAFQRGERIAFVTTFGTGGTGLNLTRANKMCIANLPWTETALAQARDRIFRIGQSRDTNVWIMILNASVDIGTYFLLRHKGKANYKTVSIDKIKKGDLPDWAMGSVMDHAKKKQNINKYRQGFSQNNKATKNHKKGFAKNPGD